MLKKLHIITLLLSLCSFAILAQTGTVKGTLLDLKTKEALIGASILLEGTSLGAAADIDGNYTISRVPVGTYTAIISFVGYKTLKVSGITVESDKITLINSSLDEDAENTTLEEVVVVGTRSTNTEIAVISEIKEASQVVSGISAQQIIKSQDRDAGEVVRRIPGVTVVDNRFIIIRGLN
ncbi:MAG: carboxypeptidase-like regulatory domain-containing protein, partial [Verrucomicrobia bacterium]|nr:carboxypeptidase-like regulatory domain-containing protein [Cytophagales bacterium]